MLKKLKNLNIDESVFIAISVIYMEILLRLFTCERFFGIGLIFAPIFSLVLCLFISAICSFVDKKTAKIINICFLSVITLIFLVQTVYHGFFNQYFIFYSLKAGGLGQITENGMLSPTIKAILSALPNILLLILPLVIYCIFGNKQITHRKRRFRYSILSFIASVCLHLIAILTVAAIPSIADIQFGEFDTNLSVSKFGLLRTEILDMNYNIIGIEQKTDIEQTTPIINGNFIEPPIVEPSIDTSPNVMNIDFEALNTTANNTYRTLNDYFASKTPTLKNQYTGMYKGYNLISITAEGFSPYAIDPVLTPTLYKMSQEGFKFENFYTPIWGVSTSDGEYAACTGLIPKSGVWSFYRSGSNYMPFCLGNMFRNIGITETYAYHNHTHNYYRRDVSHPNMGYTYKGYGTGVEKYVKGCWPESDYEMIAGSVNDYLKSDTPFHAYYMTVSGHLQYSFIGNSMSSRNRKAVEHLQCSEKLKAYYACNIELDKAMEKLLQELNAAGKADTTVITITPDHYPYGLENDTDTYSVWRELLGHDVDTTFELYESSFILYCQGTKDAPTISKNCSSIDILPTVLNLFGFEYDSRLLIGTDILSTSENIVQFNDRSFITSMGKYNAQTKEFTLHDGKSFADEKEKTEYIANIRNIINNNFKTSAKILETDYYGYLFNK